MKKLLVSAMIALMSSTMIVGCGGGTANTTQSVADTQNETTGKDTDTINKELEDKSNDLKKVKDVIEETTPEETTTEEVVIDEASLQEQLDAQELHIISTDYLIQDVQYKTLYPDILSATLKNDTEYDIKNAVVAFVAWDKNNLPLKIKGDIDFSDGTYIKEVDYSDINLVPGDTFGETQGFAIDENCKVVTFKAIVVSYEAFTGETWENPLYRQWKSLYEGVKLQ